MYFPKKSFIKRLEYCIAKAQDLRHENPDKAIQFSSEATEMLNELNVHGVRYFRLSEGWIDTLEHHFVRYPDRETYVIEAK